MIFARTVIPSGLSLLIAIQQSPHSAESEDWSDWADVQADLSLRSAHTHFVGFDISWLK